MTIAGQERRRTLLVLDTLAYDMILGVNILEEMGLEITIKGRSIFPQAITVPSSTIGLSSLIDLEREAFDKLVSKEKILSENIQGPTHLVKYEIRLLDSNPIKQTIQTEKSNYAAGN